MITGNSPAIAQLRQEIARLAASSCNVLISGETGTGKEVVARELHVQSLRGNGRFVAVNCSALPDTLIESEFFGYCEGAFTGALRAKVGLVERAHQGTLFLDEISEASPALQAKLLRVIQEQEFTRLGGHEAVKVDVRIVAAGNGDLEAAIREKRFREDLYYRVNGARIFLPPLRERKEDLPDLARAFLPPGQEADPALFPMLADYAWPGNIRELKNVVEKMCLFAAGRPLTPDDLPQEIRDALQVSHLLRKYPGRDFRKARDEFEKRFLAESLRLNHFNITKTAQQIGINRIYLHRMINKFGILPRSDA